MKNYDQQQKFLPPKLLDSDDLPETRSVMSDRQSQKIAAFSAPPILLDPGARFYEDFLSEITQADPQLDRYGLVQTLHKMSEENISTPAAGYRKLSLQTEEEYHSYSPPHIFNYYNSLTPEEEILNSLEQTTAWARDQYGSRAVQSIIQNGNIYAKEVIFEALIQEIIDLTKDKFGNYVFQKIFQKGEESHQERLFVVVLDNLLQFSENCYGCRVVQKAIEYTRYRPELQPQIIAKIEPFALYLIENINGNHVMQKCIEMVSLPLLTSIIKVISDNYRKLSLHAYGCRVIQKYLEKLRQDIIYEEELLIKSLDKQEQQHLREDLKKIKARQQEIFQKLVAISVELSQCQYGNYVMQHIVSNSKDYKTTLENFFLDNFEQMSSNKYASNVIERVIKQANAQYKESIVKRLSESESLVILAKHQFGNYVIQSLFHQIPPQLRSKLKAKLKENTQEISKSQYGRHVLLQAEKMK